MGSQRLDEQNPPDGEPRVSRGAGAPAAPISLGASLGPFEIVSALGAGSMGEVYRAHDRRLGRDVALKILRTVVPVTEELLRRFEQEARAAAVFQHPNIVAIHE